MMARNVGRTVELRSVTSGEKKVLGLDVSSQTVGWGLVRAGRRPALIAYGHIRPLPSSRGLMERLDSLYDDIKRLCEELSPDVVAVEDCALFMHGRKSNAKTMMTLAVFNRVVSLAAYRKTGDVRFYPVGSIRKAVRMASALDHAPHKEEIPGIIRRCLDGEFSDVEKRGGGTAVQTYDEADGIAAAWCAALDCGKGK